MVLLIANITTADFGQYYCVAKNVIAITRGNIELHGECLLVM